MTALIQRITGPELYGLISPEITGTITDEGKEIMERSLSNSSIVWVGSDDGKVLGFWGLIPPSLLSDRAYLWLYTTPNLTEHSFVFVRHSQKVIAEALAEYPIIVGHGVKGATKSLRWLRWLGAQFGEPQGRLIPFEIRAK